MCMVSLPAKLKNTNILVAPNTKTGRQLTVYSNDVANKEADNAMVIPVPFPESVEFVDLSGYSKIFADAEKSFPKEFYRDLSKSYSANSFSRDSSRTLEVHSVGDYQCSIAMNIDDIKNVDTSVFKLSDELSLVLEDHYKSEHWGFIICKLKNNTIKDIGIKTFKFLVEGPWSQSNNNYKKYHPFAYTHKIVGGKMFIPTRHYHGNDIDEDSFRIPTMKKLYNGFTSEHTDDWDHNIYVYNGSGPLNTTKHSTTDTEECCVDFRKCSFMPDNMKSFKKVEIHGSEKNIDIIVDVVY